MMTSVKIEDSVKPKKKIQRLRTGCWTCRRRGYKCDEAKPVCKNCTRLQIACEGYGIRLKWQDEQTPQKKGRKRNYTLTASPPTNGNSIPSTPAEAPSSYQQSVLNSEQLNGYQHVLGFSKVPNNTQVNQANQISHMNQIEDSDFIYSSPSTTSPSMSAGAPMTPPMNPPYTSPYFDNTPPPITFPQPTVPLPSPASANNIVANDIFPIANSFFSQSAPAKSSIPDKKKSNESILLTHFLRSLVHELNAIEPSTNFNYFRDMLFPLHQSCESLKNALCGLSARHMSQLYPEYISRAMEYKVEALRCLREELLCSHFNMKSLTTILILGVQEVYESNHETWRQHVEGAMRGILGNDKRLLRQAESDPFASMTVAYLEYQDTMCHLLTGGPTLLSRFGSEVPQWGTKTGPFIRTIGPLYKSLAQISLVAYELSNAIAPAYVAGQHMKRIAPVFAAIDFLQWPPHLTENRFDIQIALNMWLPEQPLNSSDYAAVRVLKYATELYYLMRFDATEFGQHLSANIETIVSDALGFVSAIPTFSSASALLSWPMWQIGIACESHEHQQQVLTMLEQCKWKTNKLSLQSIIDFLQLLWFFRRDPQYAGYSYRELLTMTMQQTPPVILY
ncbi:hypothetical protein TRVA0_062S00166 [Trichomonascus vanleenenianus]|uniref:Zn(II)2Cys6 transcription factor n=1 Tax=Trichomonascus vanleenenianus TaxID=2268995 RepID=UPI003EC96F89